MFRYSAILTEAMRRHRITLRDLSKATGKTYEHIRRIANGNQIRLSRSVNDLLCTAVGLNADLMWTQLIEQQADAHKRRKHREPKRPKRAKPSKAPRKQPVELTDREVVLLKSILASYRTLEDNEALLQLAAKVEAHLGE